MKEKLKLKAIGMAVVLLLGTIILSCDKNELLEPVPQQNEGELTLKCATCTLTPGYWMTHNNSFKGGASKKADDTWDLIGPSAENEMFCQSGQTYFEVLWTPPKGNVYYILAHPYIAAMLNALAGASVPPEVQEAIDNAQNMFQNYTPDDAAGLKGKDKTDWTVLATILDNYNNGFIGPGHCPD